MTKNCKFTIDVTYNSGFFGEEEIKQTIQNAISELNQDKINKFGKSKIYDYGKFNNGVVSKIHTTESSITSQEKTNIDLIETLVSLSSCMDDDDEPNLVLPDYEETYKKVAKHS